MTELPVCPKCGCPARYVRYTARVVVTLYDDGSEGCIRSVGRRRGKDTYECGGGHVFSKQTKRKLT